MKNPLKILFAIFAPLAATACVHQDPDYSACEPETTGIRLLFDWISPAVPRAETTSLNLEITGDNPTSSLPASSPVAGRDLDILPGFYRFTAWETAANITVDGTMLTLSTPEGVATDPQYFTAGTTTDTVEDTEDYQEIHVPMYLQTRDLIIRIRFLGDGVSLIRDASASLSGVAFSRDVVFGFPPVDGRIRPQAVMDGPIEYNLTENAGYWFEGRRTLLGIDGDNVQNLSVTVGFDDNNSLTEEIEVTADFNGFHTVDVDEPWYLVLELEVGVSFDMIIVDWYSGAESWLEAQ